MLREDIYLRIFVVNIELLAFDCFCLYTQISVSVVVGVGPEGEGLWYTEGHGTQARLTLCAVIRQICFW